MAKSMISSPTKEGKLALEPTNLTRIIGLDYLRGVASISVVIYHYLKYLKIENGILYNVFKYGYLGVDLFFVISGYVIFYSLKSKNTLVEFAISRISRLYPTYWAGVILTTFFILVFKFLFNVGDNWQGWKAFLVNLTMTQEFFNIPNIDGAYWTLAYELVFYAIIGISFFIFRHNRCFDIFLFAYLLLSLLYKIDRFNIPFEALATKFLIVDKIPLFLAGLSIFKIKCKEQFGWVLFLSSILIYNFFLLKSSISNWQIFLIINCIFLSVLIASVINFKLEHSWLHHPLYFFGKISYPLYLIHGEISWLLFMLLVPFLNKNNSTLLVGTLCILFAYQIHKKVEGRYSKHLKNRLLGLFQ